MPKPNKQRLIKEALQARRFASAPYSNFQVGAALLTTDGKIITGANVESASYGLTCCAERVALFKALTSGHKKFRALAIAAPAAGAPTPCGACRQLLREYAPDALVWICDSDAPREIKEFTVKALLPHPFLAGSLGTIRKR